MAELDLKCPKCGSEDVKKLSLIHKNGISDVNLGNTNYGVGYSGGTGVIGMVSSGTSRGTNQTAASMLASPPEPMGKKKFLSTIIKYLILGAFIGMGIGTIFYYLHLPTLGQVVMEWGPLILPIYIAVKISKFNSNVEKYNNTDYREKFKKWQNSYMCQRCENVFTAE